MDKPELKRCGKCKRWLLLSYFWWSTDKNCVECDHKS